jgi:hypothetical protein
MQKCPYISWLERAGKAPDLNHHRMKRQFVFESEDDVHVAE